MPPPQPVAATLLHAALAALRSAADSHEDASPESDSGSIVAMAALPNYDIHVPARRHSATPSVPHPHPGEIRTTKTLTDLIPDAALAFFQAASPAATAAALSDLEAQQRRRRGAARYDLLAGLAAVHTCPPYVAVCVFTLPYYRQASEGEQGTTPANPEEKAGTVGNAAGACSRHAHVVLLRAARALRVHHQSHTHRRVNGEHMMEGGEMEDVVEVEIDAPVHDTVACASCDCRGFAFRPPVEAFCRHIVVAAVAVGLRAVRVGRPMSEPDFIRLLEP